MLVVVMLAQPTISVVGAIPRQKRFAIVDVFDSASQLDNQGAFISLATRPAAMQLKLKQRRPRAIDRVI